jgi:hypothetical protein
MNSKEKHEMRALRQKVAFYMKACEALRLEVQLLQGGIERKEPPLTAKQIDILFNKGRGLSFPWSDSKI